MGEKIFPDVLSPFLMRVGEKTRGRSGDGGANPDVCGSFLLNKRLFLSLEPQRSLKQTKKLISEQI